MTSFVLSLGEVLDLVYLVTDRVKNHVLSVDYLPSKEGDSPEYLYLYV